MYEYLKKLLEVAENIGTIETAEMYPKGTYRASGVEIAGVIADGRTFELRLRIDEKEEAAE